jgi:hypothetical protein
LIAVGDPDDSELGAVWRASLTLGAYGQGVRILTLTGAAERSFLHDLAGNRPGLEDLDAPSRAGEKWPPTCDSFKRASARRAALALPGVRNWGTVTPIFPRVGLQSKAKLDAELKAGAGTQLLPWTSSVAWRLSVIVADMNPRSAPRLTLGAPMLLRFRPALLLYQRPRRGVCAPIGGKCTAWYGLSGDDSHGGHLLLPSLGAKQSCG